MAGGDQPEKPISLFYSYSHKDEELRNRLEEHLAVLRWNGQIREWHDRNIDLGEEWAKEIDRNLASADIILLLVSASFIASKYSWSVEMTKALERHDKGDAKVIPVILRHCRWGGTPFAKLQAAPKDGKPVSSWRDQDEALDDVVTRIERVVAELQRQRRAVDRLSQSASDKPPRKKGGRRCSTRTERRLGSRPRLVAPLSKCDGSGLNRRYRSSGLATSHVLLPALPPNRSGRLLPPTSAALPISLCSAIWMRRGVRKW